MKRSEWNSKAPLARFAFSIWHLLTLSLASCARFVATVIWRLQGRSHELKNTHGRRPLSGQRSLEEASAYHAAYDRPYVGEQDLEPDAAHGGQSRWRNLHVALLDDNPAILDFLETSLAVDGHSGERYTEGQSLLDAILPPTPVADVEFVPPYDLIILDLLLPGRLSGADVFLAIRKRFTAEQLPMIVITAVDELTLQQFRLILPDDVPLLRKPFPPRVLRHLIAQLTNNGI